MIDGLRKFLAPEIIFGLDARLLVARCVKNFGARRVLVVSDPGVMAAGWGLEVVHALQADAISHQLFTDISPNPRSAEVMKGAAIYDETNCDVIVAVGGGSVIDCAKALGIVCTNQKHVLEFEGVDKVPVPMPPIVCIPTTGGTSADVSQFAIVSNESERVKIAIISKSVVPDIALIDPLTLTTMSPFLTACTGMDALVHAVEAYVSNANSDLTDLHALEAVRLLAKHLVQSVENGQDLVARQGVMLASLQAGLAFSNASLGAVHAMAHSLGGMLDLPHGECNAMLLPHVVSFNHQSVPERFAEIGKALGIEMQGRTQSEARAAIVDYILDLQRLTGTNATLGARGISRSDVSTLARKAMADACIVTNPRRPVQRDIEVIFEEAL